MFRQLARLQSFCVGLESLSLADIIAGRTRSHRCVCRGYSSRAPVDPDSKCFSEPYANISLNYRYPHAVHAVLQSGYTPCAGLIGMPNEVWRKGRALWAIRGVRTNAARGCYNKLQNPNSKHQINTKL